MAEKEFSLDDILDELKGQLKANGVTDITDEEIKKYSMDVKKYDTGALLQEVTSALEQQQSAPLPQAAEKPAEESKQQLEPVPEAAEPLKEDAPQAADEQAEQAPAVFHTSEELQKQQQLEQERLRELMLSTAHLKYISLRKNRERLVKEFVLKPQFTLTQPVEVHKEIRKVPPKPADAAAQTANADTDERGIRKVKQLPPEDADALEEEETGAPSIWDKITERFRRKPEPQSAAEQSGLDEYTSPKQNGALQSDLQRIRRSVTIRTAVLAVLFVCSLGLLALNGMDGGSPIAALDRVFQPKNFCIANFVLMMAASLTVIDTIGNGMAAVFRQSIGRHTPYAFAMILTLLNSVFFLVKPEAINEKAVSLYVPLAILCSLVMMIGRLLGIKRVIINFKMVSGDFDKYSVDIMSNKGLAEDFTKGALEEDPCLVYNKKTPFLSHFLDESFCEDASDQVARQLFPFVGAIAAVMAIVVLAMGDGPFVALTALTGILLVGTGVVPMVMVNFPLYSCAKNLSKLGGAVLGYDAVEEFSDVNSVLLSADQIFYGKDVTLYGIKTFSGAVIDRVILDATAVLCASNSILGDVFLNIIGNRKDFLDPVDSVIYEDGMGISAWVKNRRVLIGSRELMINHNVKVPGREYEDQYLANDRNLVYLSTGGELSAVFVIGLECSEDVRNMVDGLYNNDIVCVVKTVDPILTQSVLARVFDVPEEAFRVIPSRLHKEFVEISKTDQPAFGAVSNNGTLPAYVYSFLLAKRLNRVIRWGTMLNYAAMGVGVLLFVAFALVGGLGQLSNVTLCVYEGICLLLCLILQKLSRL